jgi:hypothetical protein
MAAHQLSVVVPVLALQKMSKWSQLGGPKPSAGEYVGIFVCRHILVLDIYVFVKGNMGRREYYILQRIWKLKNWYNCKARNRKIIKKSL